MSKVRLTCLCCDASEDGTTTVAKAIKAGWTEIGRVQTYAQSIQPSPPATSVLDWYTHAGLCPDCKGEHG